MILVKDNNGEIHQTTDGSSLNITESKRVLLWENQNPTNSFDAQSINLSEQITNYNAILVYFRNGDTTTPRYFYNLLPTEVHTQFFYSNGSSNNTGSRTVNYTNSTTLAIGEGEYGGSTANNDAVPIKIYGVVL